MIVVGLGNLRRGIQILDRGFSYSRGNHNRTNLTISIGIYIIGNVSRSEIRLLVVCLMVFNLVLEL